MSTSVGIQIPPGDVGDLKRAATLHAQLADELGHGQLTLVHSSFQLATAWEGAAAKAYSEYSAHVSARYGDASDQAREIAHLLKGWAGALEEDQARSRKLLGEGEETAKRIDAGEAALRRDRSVLASHERALAAAKAEPRTVLTAELVDSQVRACEALVTTWTHTVAAEVKALAGLREDLESLQREATRVYEAAEELASRHNAYLSNISVIAPAPAQVPAGSPVQPLAAVPAVAGLASSSISESAGSDPPGSISGGDVTVPPVVSGPAPARVAAMLRQAKALLGQPYVWGGGHSGWGPQPGYDCSGFVSKVLHAGGFLASPQNTTGIAGSPGIANGPGHYVTIYDRTDMGSGQDHVIIDLNGHWYESGGSAGTWGGGGGVEAITRPSASYLASFNRVLHPQGM